MNIKKLSKLIEKLEEKATEKLTNADFRINIIKLADYTKQQAIHIKGYQIIKCYPDLEMIPVKYFSPEYVLIIEGCWDRECIDEIHFLLKDYIKYNLVTEELELI